MKDVSNSTPAPARVSALVRARAIALAGCAWLALPAFANDTNSAPADPTEQEDAAERDEQRHVVDLDFDFDMGVFAIEEDQHTSSWRLLDLWIVSLVEVERNDSGDSHVSILDGPGFALFESKRDGERSRIRVLDLPLFALYRSDVGRAPNRDLRVLDLPIVGSLFRRSQDEREIDWRVLFLFGARADAPAPLALPEGSDFR